MIEARDDRGIVFDEAVGYPFGVGGLWVETLDLLPQSHDLVSGMSR